MFSRLKYDHVTKLPPCPADSGTYYGPVRLFDAVHPSVFDSGKVLLQVRDPRDILTSLYFSLRYSHIVPENDPGRFLLNRQRLQDVDIDDFVLENADEIKNRFDRFESFLPYKNVLLLRYENMVTQFDDWFDQVVHFCGLTWNLKLRRCLNSIREEADFTVREEDLTKHKRQVQPGDYRRKLRPDTIESLNQKFASTFDVFYEADSRVSRRGPNSLVSC